MWSTWCSTRPTGEKCVLVFHFTALIHSDEPTWKLICVFYHFRLFEMGFAEQLQEIIRRLPDTRQTLLFSATLPKLLVEFARAGEGKVTSVELKLSLNITMITFSTIISLNFFALKYLLSLTSCYLLWLSFCAFFIFQSQLF